jgi:hypothetical protein
MTSPSDDVPILVLTCAGVVPAAIVAPVHDTLPPPTLPVPVRRSPEMN